MSTHTNTTLKIHCFQTGHWNTHTVPPISMQKLIMSRQTGISNPWHPWPKKVSTWINSEYHVGRLVCSWKLKVRKAEERYPQKAAVSSFHRGQLHLEPPYYLPAGPSGNQQELEALPWQKKGVAISSDLIAYFTDVQKETPCLALDTKTGYCPLKKRCWPVPQPNGVILVKLLGIAQRNS